MIELGPPAPTPRPFRIVDRAGALAIVRGGDLAPSVATILPYRPDAERLARELVDAANEHRECIAALRLLFAAAERFQTRPSVRGWTDLSDARRVARDVLAGPKA